MSICVECFYLKQSNGGTKCTCSKGYLRGSYPKDHPFVTAERNCPDYDEDQPMEFDVLVKGDDKDEKGTKE